MEAPILLKGNKFIDERGIITYNNDFDSSSVKRIYTIENNNLEFKRGWQGHKIEQRWFAVMTGSFEISVQAIVALENKALESTIYKFNIKEDSLDYLWVPAGYATCIQGKEPHSKLLLMGDYTMGEIQDEWRFEL